MHLALVGLIYAATTTPPPRAQPVDAQAIIINAPGGLFDRDEADSVGASEIRGSGSPDVFAALARSLPGISLQEAQDNPFQPNLVYRGFTASPLQGQAQGLAIYVDGVRFNQPFGDTVQFDLLPQSAIQRVDLLHASAVYGLNALGGAAVIETKTGRTAPGYYTSFSAGQFGRRQATAEGGWSSNHASAYFALEQTHDGGWRRFSPSTLYNGLVDLGWDAAKGGVHFKLTGADTDLTGNGSAPVELLAADYRAVFTHPDRTRNRYARLSLHPWLSLGSRTLVQMTLYRQEFRQHTLNGDAAQISPCTGEPAELCLGGGDGAQSMLEDTGGDPIPDLRQGSEYGLVNRSTTRTASSGVLAQLVDTRPINGQQNKLVVGGSIDASRTGFESSSELGALDAERAVNGLGPIIAEADGAIAPVSLTSSTRYHSLFVSDRLPVADSLKAEIALRWNDAIVALRDHSGTTLNGDHLFRRVNPGAELDWAKWATFKVNAGYSEANRAPTPAELSCADEKSPCSLTNFFVGDPALKQVVARSFNLGMEGTIRSVDWHLTAYRTTNGDDIELLPSTVLGRAFFRNVGDTRRQGIEASISYHKGAIRLQAGYALTIATFETPLTLNSPDNPAADSQGHIHVHPGNRLPGVPKNRIVISASYQPRTWSLGADVERTSGQYLFGDESNLLAPTKAYQITNLRGSIRLAGRVRLFGEVRNVFDKHYATFGTLGPTGAVELVEAPGAADPRSVSPGRPRSWQVGLGADF